LTAQTLDLADRTCIVTGAAQGIGAAEAVMLAGRGATVLCADRSDTGTVVGSNPRRRRRRRVLAPRHHGGWRGRAIARHWRTEAELSDRPRRIINTSSESGLYGNAGQSNDAAAKAGLAALTLTLAAELARLGVCVNAIAPRARTPMSSHAFGTLDADALPPSRVAQVVAWLASSTGEGITGQLLVVAGRDVQRMSTWSARTLATQPDAWSAEAAAGFRAALFPHRDTSHLPAPISDLFTARPVAASS